MEREHLVEAELRKERVELDASGDVEVERDDDASTDSSQERI